MKQHCRSFASEHRVLPVSQTWQDAENVAGFRYHPESDVMTCSQMLQEGMMEHVFGILKRHLNRLCYTVAFGERAFLGFLHSLNIASPP
jgi:hypothetical protein